ncbi:chemotaxis protein CheD [Andreprevotia lacus DSM 23236]|jgi:chemotaxis protein CheD|uniref:Probable chemoreceptor glutamine deamidase CheD n=1 Tax=Andreprevotia lacus DSM 23236 TaxID=1121001 RepID=A0A1W1X2X5_9NEIS|nr:chemotaxis protein CheD [Andreprevotia lacus]SMC18120.1 chemotaxis protein CheD [Andreprevotia lacus DSM 23236]
MSRRIFVNPGEIYFGSGDVHVETLLGSCVAITFWHPVRRLGGLCHFLLPSRLHTPGKAMTRDGRYGEEAVQHLLDEVKLHGTRIEDYAVKVFGGGRVFDTEPQKASIGETNALFAISRLQQLRIPVAVQDITGYGYRYLRFDLGSGDVWIRRGRGIAMDKKMSARELTESARK